MRSSLRNSSICIVNCVIAMSESIGANKKPGFYLLYFLLLLSFLNAVLRPAADIPITPYYILAPFVAIWLLAVSANFRLMSAFLFFVASYGLVVGILAGTPLLIQFSQLTKYAQLLVIFGVLRWLQKNDSRFYERCAKLVIGFSFGIAAIALLQLLTGFQFPAVINDESALWLNTFFFTPNDLALFLAPVLVLVLLGSYSWIFKFIFFGFVFALNLRNDAKAILITMIILVFGYVCIKLSKRYQIPSLLVMIGVIGSAIAMLGVYAEFGFELNDQEITALDLLIDPIERIFALEPYNLGGSIFDRADAVIHALTALRDNWWFGLGPGGSVHILTLPAYELLTAKSLHNAIAELFVDFGPIFIVLAAMFVLPVLSEMASRRPLAQRSTGRALLLLCAPFLAVSQSSGYISNYAFWIAAYLVWNWEAMTLSAKKSGNFARIFSNKQNYE